MDKDLMCGCFCLLQVYSQTRILLGAKGHRDLLCQSPGCVQFHSWLICGGEGTLNESIVTMSAMRVQAQGEPFGQLHAILTLKPSAISACWSCSVSSNCLP